MKQRIDKKKAYRKNIQLIRIMKERQLTYTSRAISSSKKYEKEKKYYKKKVRTTHTNMQKEDYEILIFTMNHYPRNS